MDLSVITVVSLLMMFSGRIAAEENGEDVGIDPSVSNVFTRYGSDHCCRRIDNQTMILKGISSATEKLTKDVGEMKTGVEDGIPSQLEKLSSELKSELKGQSADLEKLSSELKGQSADLEKLSSELKSELKGQSADLEKLSSELKSELKGQSADLEKLSSELKGQSADLEKLSSELKSDLRVVKASVSDMSISLSKHSDDLLAHDARMKELRLLLENMNSVIMEIHVSLTTKPKDCSDIRAMGHSTSGVYRVYPGSQFKRIQADVYCDLTTPGGNWLIFQRRKDGSENFERTWIEYLNGFGNPDGEFWLGNEALYLLTSNGKYKLRIDLEDFDGKKKYAEYSTFSIGSSADKYRLTVSGYTGDAGDSFSYHNGMQFSAKDADNDVSGSSCSEINHGAWWYKNCHQANLNGLYLRGLTSSYAKGVVWVYFHGYHYSLKLTEMKIAAVN